MDEQTYTGVILSDFNVDTFAAYLNQDSHPPALTTVAAPYGQLMPLLLDESSAYWQSKPDFLVVWSQPHSVIESFNRLLTYDVSSIDHTLHEVDGFCEALLKLDGRSQTIFIPSWSVPPYHRGFGMSDLKNNMGITNTLIRMNLRLCDNLAGHSNYYILDSSKWIQVAGSNAFIPKLWYMGKIPFGHEVFKEAVKDIKSALRGLRGQAKKIILMDLDNTIWGGVVGDVGWENLRLGGHDHIGEAFVDFQLALKSLKNRGILLGIISKNDERVALEAINKHPEMVLRLTDFVGWKINWKDKAENILSLLSELKLTPEAAVFIDDNPVEQARVREALSEVFVPEWPQDKLSYKKALLNLDCFDSPMMSQEDLKRTQLYIADRDREVLRQTLPSIDDWLKSLHTVVTIDLLNSTNIQRSAQLLNKTNQMNLSTRRMSERELLTWAREKDHKFWTFSVADKFGDSGLTGLLSLQVQDDTARIIDFVLSCRVMGRKIEETMLHIAVHYAQSLGLQEVRATYLPTKHNRPCLEFWQSSGFSQDGTSHSFHWNARIEYPRPVHIRLEEKPYVG